MSRVLKYIERSTGASHNGEAWIGYVDASKTGRTIYFNGRAFARSIRGGFADNHHDVETYEAYWISGVKKRGTNRHWAGSGKIQIESTAVSEYLEWTGADELDLHEFEIVDPRPLTDKERIRKVLNESLCDEDDAV
ncbi:MAG: mannose-1-phosphate guanylyltransferase [Myxococcota bacterium]